MNAKIKFKDLSTPLKVAIVFAWIYAVFFTLSFGFGMLEGLLA